VREPGYASGDPHLGGDAEIVDHRFPLFRNQLDAVVSSGSIDRLRRHAVVSLGRASAERGGWDLVDEPGMSDGSACAVLVLGREGADSVLRVDGFETTVDLGEPQSARDRAVELMGRSPRARRPSSPPARTDP
jgi:hypothetical protein